MQTISIIGGTGFIGDYLVNNLSKTDFHLRTLYRFTPPSKKVSGVEYLKLDGSKDFKGLKKILSSTDYLVILSRPNKELIKNIISTDLKFKKIIYASTILIYPDEKIAQNENARLIAANQYEQDKLSEERLLTDFAKKSGNKLTIARLTNVYGDIKNRALIHWILSAVADDENFKLNNKGESVRDFIFVEDVAKYLELLVKLPQQNNVEIFNVCTGKGFDIKQVIKKIESISGKKLTIEDGLMTNEKKCVIGNNSKIVMATGYKPKYDLKSGLKNAYQNYLKAKNVS